MSGDLVIWTIYNRPLDYPAGFVVVPWTIRRGKELRGDSYHAPSLEAARALLPPGLYRMPREPGDDPAIEESWL